VKAVLDANVFVAALIFPGGTADMDMQAAVKSHLEMGVCPCIHREFLRSLPLHQQITTYWRAP